MRSDNMVVKKIAEYNLTGVGRDGDKAVQMLLIGKINEMTETMKEIKEILKTIRGDK